MPRYDDARTRRRGRRGQAALESMMMMAFMLVLIFGVMHLTMFVVTRYMVNYAAFAAARAAAVGRSPQAAARAVMDNLNWWRSDGRDVPVDVDAINRAGWEGYRVRTRVPFGLPIYNRIEPDGVELEGSAPTTTQSNPPSGGDNGQ